jgi:hypothetical protein
VQNITLRDGYSAVRQTPGASFGGGGGGAIFDEGGQLKVAHSRFIDNRCYLVGPDLGGAAIRALAQYDNNPSTSAMTASPAAAAPTAAR